MNQRTKTGVPAVEALTSQDLNPVEFFTEAIGSARQRIAAVVYKFTDPCILESLNQALLRGVMVRLLMDGSKACSASSKAGQLSSRGAEVRLWGNKAEKLHAKFMVVDDHRVTTGSSNWTISARKSNMELLLHLEGTNHAERFLAIFDCLWAAGRRYPAEGHDHVNRS